MNIKKERLLGILLISTFLLTLTVLPVRAYDYPPVPQLNLELGTVTGTTFWTDVSLMGEGGVCLDPFWDVAGIDAYVHFDPAILRTLSVSVDPDGWFQSFWPRTIQKRSIIDNAAGTVHVIIAGVPAPDGVHAAVMGHGRLFSVKLQGKSSSYVPDLADVTLLNPRTYAHRATIDSDAGLIDLTDPFGTGWHGISSDDYGIPFTLDDWVDTDGSGELGTGDDLVLTDTSTEMWHPYEINDMKATLTLAQQPFSYVDDYIWTADFTDAGLGYNGLPGRATGGGTGAAFNGYGNPYWTGNFSLAYPLASVNQIVAHFLPFTGDEYTQVLTEGVDYKVHPDEDLVELLHPLDVPIINEHWTDGVDNKLNGWPFINYFASGIESVYRKFPAYNAYYGESEGFATNTGFEKAPPAEWWYEPDWQWELEGWWALGYYKGPWVWPAGTEWWINYTAASYVTVDFNADFDPRPYSVEFDGSYGDFLALGDPVGTSWNEVYPNSLGVHSVVSWTDSDESGTITVGDYLDLEGAVGIRTYLVNNVATDLIVDQVRTIDDVDMTSPFYSMEPIVSVAGFPHPEREMSPWHNSESSRPIPHTVGYLMPTWPTAEFTVSPRYALPYESFVFDASGSSDPDGSIVSYEWNFGDGATATGVTATHAYGHRGFYTTTLKVTDNGGLTDCTRKTIAVQPVTVAKAEHSVYFVSKDEDVFNDLIVGFVNDGTTSVEISASFATYDKRTGILLGMPLTTSGIATVGTTTELTVGWNPADYGFSGAKSYYVVTVELRYKDVDGTFSAGVRSINFNVFP